MSRRRYIVPVAAAGLVAVAAAAPSLAASASPRLAPVPASTVVAEALSSRVSAFSGQVAWNADLGIPSLASLTTDGGQSVPSGGSFSPMSLLSGTSDFSLWVDGGSRQRIASDGQLTEADFLHVGRSAWLWDSSNQHVTHLVAGPASSATRSGDRSPLDPVTAARQLLSGLSAHHTTVTSGAATRVAGIPARTLILAPSGADAAGSKVDDVEISVDAANGLPLRVTVRAAGQVTPALEVGFTSIHFGAPAASVFTAPAGRTTTTRHLAAGASPTGSAPLAAPQTIGTDWTRVAVVNLPSAGTRAGQELDRRLSELGTQVSGSWGSGRLITTSLADALVLPDGRAVVGLVQPSVLEHAAGSLSR